MDKNTKTPKKATRKLKPVAGTRAATEKLPTMRNVDAWFKCTIGRKKIVITAEQERNNITMAIIVNGKVVVEQKTTRMEHEVPDVFLDLFEKAGIKL